MQPGHAWFFGVLAGATAVVIAACAALEHDAQVIAPGLESGCSFAEAASGENPWVEFACVSAEYADQLILKFPTGTAAKVSSNTILAPDGGTVATQYRVRLRGFRFVPAPSDAGGQ